MASAGRRPTTAPLYINRELSWLEFNARVLDEARDERNPLLERAKFLAIFSSNLDEFFQVRVSGLKQQLASGATPSPDGLTPDEQLGLIRVRVRELLDEQGRIFAGLRAELAAADIRIVDYADVAATPRHAPRAVPRGDLPGPDAARGRSRAPVPVHQHAQPLARGRRPRPRHG